MNYAELKVTTASYLHRDDLTDSIPHLITLAQSRINHDLDITALHKSTYGMAVAGYGEVDLPDDCLSLMSVRIEHSGGYVGLEQRTLAQNVGVLEQRGGANGTPAYYSRYGNKLEVTPTPDADTTMIIFYKKRLTAFSEDSDTNDILTDHPNIYVYAVMLEADPFIMNDERVVVWKDLYMEEVTKINAAEFEYQWSGAPLKIASPNGGNTP